MGVYERELEKEEVENLVSDFTSRPDFEKTVQQIDEPDYIFKNKYSDIKGFEVINEITIDNKALETSETTLYLKYQNDTLIKLSELKVNKDQNDKENKLFTVDISILQYNGEGKNLRKIASEDGTVTTDTTIENPNESYNDIPVYLEVLPESDDGSTITASPVPCLDWTGSGTCCTFRYNGNPFNDPVTYNWCGANCGGGCSNSPGMVNDLDSCCKLHDCCYVRNSGYPDRCNCDRKIIDCTDRTDNAGGSRVKTAFQLKMAAFC